jgi:hypothetical protein
MAFKMNAGKRATTRKGGVTNKTDRLREKNPFERRPCKSGLSD